MFTSQNLIYKENPEANKGAMYCSIILGADKTMVSVSIGHVKYHPLYISLSNFHGSLQCTHHNTVILIGILATSKCMWFKFLSLLCNQLTLHPHKWPQVWLWSRISNLQVQALSFINLCYSQYLTTSYANSCCMPLPWWSLLQSHFWLGVLHCRLSQTSISFRNHTKLVSQVSCQL